MEKNQIKIDDIKFIETRVTPKTRHFGGEYYRRIVNMVGTFKNQVAYDIYLDGQKIAAWHFNEDYIWRTRKDAGDAIDAANREDRQYFIDEQAEVAAAKKRHQASSEQQEEGGGGQQEEEGGGPPSIEEREQGVVNSSQTRDFHEKRLKMRELFINNYPIDNIELTTRRGTKRGQKGTYYEIQFTIPGIDISNIWKRYSEFDDWRTKLKKEISSIKNENMTQDFVRIDKKFPGKKWNLLLNIEKRERLLNGWIVEMNGFFKTLDQSGYYRPLGNLVKDFFQEVKDINRGGYRRRKKSVTKRKSRKKAVTKRKSRKKAVTKRKSRKKADTKRRKVSKSRKSKRRLKTKRR